MRKLLINRGTFCLLSYNKETSEKKKYYLQFSLINPWLLPKKGVVCNGKITLWGWLFIYVGCDTNMLKKRIKKQHY